MNNRFTQWILINLVRWLLPLLVIYILFIVFKELSYFDFISKETNQAIRYGGPIGAYIFLFLIGHRLIPHFDGKLEKSDPSSNYKDLLGDWDVMSLSKDNNTVYKGKLSFSIKDDGLLIQGTFNHVDNAVSNYASDMTSTLAKVEDSKIHIVYSMHDSRKDLKMDGYSVLNIDASRKKLEGYWNAVGSDKRGTVVYTKIDKKNGGAS